MGGAYSTIAADVLARFQRMRGKAVTFVTGTDEHGEKIAASAAAAGAEPQAHCDRIAERYRALWSKLGISYDRFIRTTDARHEATVRSLLELVWQRGDVYAATYCGAYCVGCEEYKDSDDLDAEGRCLVHRKPCPERQEENYFFALSKYTAAVQAYVADASAVQPERARNEVVPWVAEGARDFSISRAAVDWGIHMPRDPSHTVYVWFDALIGYLSALLPETAASASMEASRGTCGGGDGIGGAGDGESTVKALLAAGWPADVHIIGKDILRFHAVYWPGMLCSMGLPPPRKVFGHGFLTRDGLKMGKSLGNVLDPFRLTDAYGSDAVRFYFMREVAFGADGDFSESRFRDTVNAALANSLGNLINRCLNLLTKHCDGAAPISAVDVAADHPLREAVACAGPAVAEAYENLAFHDAIQGAMTISSRANQYLEETAPWTALKRGGETERFEASAALVSALEAARVTAAMLAPVTPGLSGRVYEQLGMATGPQDLVWQKVTEWGGISQGHQFPRPKPVFRRLDGDLLLSVAEPVAVAV